METYKELDVVKVKDGRIGTVQGLYPDSLLVEFFDDDDNWSLEGIPRKNVVRIEQRIDDIS